ncbi:MAG: PQQ-dependent sugar dehydrogenase [Phycisphaerales bacterium]|nr:PQQ-dependent sugar dehydrogenase [Phycisphaerales bacterium]
MLKSVIVGAALLTGATQAAQAQLTTEIYLSGLTRPVFNTHAGDGSGRMFIVEQPGRIRLVDADGNLQTTPFLDIVSSVTGGVSGGDERGLLGLAFHPDYANNGLFYVNYTTTIAGVLRTVIDEFSVSSLNPNFADPSTGRRLMTINQPFTNHNGGWIGFGPDGYLYIAMGDGGSGNDPGNRASNLTVLLGKLLRIDVDNQDPGLEYAIPADNPFVDNANARDEIWAYGLRNPWRTSFDRLTGDLWIADVGQNAREEVNFQPAGDPGGQHYGWRCREGTIPTPGISGCPTSNPLWVDPVHDYPHSDGRSITGGYAYRGCELGEAYQGLYFFSDYVSGAVWYLDTDDNFSRTTLLTTNLRVSSFGEDENGEIYIADLFTGNLHKLVLVNPDPSNCEPPFPGCNPADLAEPFGVLNFFDLAAYLDLFNDGDLAADFTGDGKLNFFDLAAYLDYFNAGCP